MAGITVQEGLKPFFVYNFHGCFGNYHEMVQAEGVFVVVVTVELEVVVEIWSDVRMQLPMRDWDGSMQ